MDNIIKLERFRNRPLTFTANQWDFLQLKSIFHLVEAVASARIEGNHTTIIEYIQSSLDPEPIMDERFVEIQNLLRTLEFIDDTINETEINGQYLREIQSIVVEDLSDEGDRNAGAYRDHPIKISHSKHQPPYPADIRDQMDELIDFINAPRIHEYEDLLKVAITHHRFVWIHPFGNGNGRTVRMLTYAMLCKQQFTSSDEFRLFNPTAVFSSNRNRYYDMLELADDLKNPHILSWCDYFIASLLSELEKSNLLSQRNFIKDNLILPAINQAQTHNLVGAQDAEILKLVVQLGAAKAKDIATTWRKPVGSVNVSKRIASLKQRKLLETTVPSGREYHLRYTGNILTYYIMSQMNAHNLLPIPIDA
jgi:Fic family protein